MRLLVRLLSNPRSSPLPEGAWSGPPPLTVERLNRLKFAISSIIHDEQSSLAENITHSFYLSKKNHMDRIADEKRELEGRRGKLSLTTLKSISALPGYTLSWASSFLFGTKSFFQQPEIAYTSIDRVLELEETRFETSQRERYFLDLLKVLAKDVGFQEIEREKLEEMIQMDSLTEGIVLETLLGDYEVARMWYLGKIHESKVTSEDLNNCPSLNSDPLILREIRKRVNTHFNERIRVQRKQMATYLQTKLENSKSFLLRFALSSMIEVLKIGQTLKLGVDESHVYSQVLIAVRTNASEPLRLKLFSNVPCHRVEMMFPIKRLKLDLFDKLIISIVFIGGSIFPFIRSTNFIKEYPEMATLTFLALGLTFAAQLHHNYVNKQTMHLLKLSEVLFYKNQASDESVVAHLLFQQRQEQIKKLLVAYAFLIWAKPMADRGKANPFASDFALSKAIDKWMSRLLADQVVGAVDMSTLSQLRRFGILQNGKVLNTDEAVKALASYSARTLSPL